MDQLVTQARSFSAILCRLNTVLHSRDAAHRIHNFCDSVTLTLAKMWELVAIYPIIPPALDFMH